MKNVFAAVAAPVATLLAVYTIAFLVAFLTGCSGPAAPAFYSISNEFPEDQHAVVTSAVEAWCAEAGACPELALFSEDAHFELVDDLPEGDYARGVCPEGATCETNGKEGHGRIRIARKRAQPDSLTALWHTAAHEFGHICIDGHVPTSPLMAAVAGVEPTLEVDGEAVAAWHAGCP